MSNLSTLRKILKTFHPEGIPELGAKVYNFLSSKKIFQSHYELVAKDILKYCSNGRLLDVGTGPGWLLLKLHQTSPNIQLTGMDISSAMVDEARKNISSAGLADKIEIKEGNASMIPFADNLFDVVVSTGSLHHWKKPMEGLNEVNRVLKSGGYALMYDLISNTPKPIMDEIKQKFGKVKSTLFWLHSFEEPFYDQKNFEALAESTLFKKGQSHFVGLLCCLVMKKQ